MALLSHGQRNRRKRYGRRERDRLVPRSGLHNNPYYGIVSAAIVVGHYLYRLSAQGLGLALKPSQSFGVLVELSREHLDRNLTIQVGVVGTVDLSQSTLARR